MVGAIHGEVLLLREQDQWAISASFAGDKQSRGNHPQRLLVSQGASEEVQGILMEVVDR